MFIECYSGRLPEMMMIIDDIKFLCCPTLNYCNPCNADGEIDI